MNQKILDFIYRLGEFQIRLGLSNSYKLMELLGNPQRHPRIIHIAGTNGKGSTLSFLEKLLLDSGFSVCLTTSPHLLSYQERFRFQGIAITAKELEQVFIEICEKCNISLDSSPENWLVQPTFFEFSIALAFYWFQKKQPDYILLETGMGGRLDSTNVVENSLVCGFTTISFDHSEFLGDSLESIANEKFGIIKPHSKIVSTKQQPLVTKILKTKFPHNQQAILGENFFLKKKKNIFFFEKNTAKAKLSFSFKKLLLAGEHQLENATVAVEIYLTAVPQKKQLSPTSIAYSLSRTRWVGRLQYIKSKAPTLLLEAAHNAQGVRILGQYLSQQHTKDKILCVIHWLKNKNLAKELKTWRLTNIQFLPVYFTHPKANDAQKIYSDLSQITNNVFAPQKLKQIIQNYINKNFNHYDLVLITGSIYLLGAFCHNLIEQNICFTQKQFYDI